MEEIFLNKKLELEITDITHECKGVGRFNNWVVFVKGALPGEKILCTITKIKKNYMEAELKKIMIASPNRVKPRCKIYESCGGCKFLHLEYKTQLKTKEKWVDNALSKIGKITDFRLLDIIGMDNPWSYRNKVIFHVGKIEEKFELGFFQEKTNKLVPLDNCLLLPEEMNDIAIDFKNHLNQYSNKKDNNKINKLLIRKSFYCDEILIGFIGNDFLPGLNDFISYMVKKYKNIKTVVFNYVHNQNDLWGKKTDVLFGEGFIKEKLGDIVYNISAESFFQINSLQAKILYEKVLEFSEINRDDTVWDIYCGTGSISLFIARYAKHVYGIEYVKKAVEDAKKNADMNNINNVKFISGKAETKILDLLKNKSNPNIVILDPPRKGCHKTVLEAVYKANPKKIIYVSCNPTTLARDLKYFEENGYKTNLVQPIDMFPHTGHVETVVALYKKD